MNRHFILIPFFCFIGIACIAQGLEEMKRQFPDKLAVFSKITRRVEIDLKEGIPVAHAKEVSEMMILDDNANGLYNKDKVYHSSFNELKKVDAYTLVREGNRAKKIPVLGFKTQSSPSQGVFYDDVRETSFDYPRMMSGSISHVETEHYNKDIRFLPGFYFSNFLPVRNASYSISYPAGMDVRYIIRNDDAGLVKVSRNSNSDRKTLSFMASNVKDYENYGDGTPVPYHALHVIVYVASYRNNNSTIPVFGSLEELYKWNARFLQDINTIADAQLKHITDSICSGRSRDLDKAKAIYAWVQDHVKYVAFEEGLEGFVPRQASDVCAKRYGDCKDMASILTAMMQLCGLDAHFTWIGTRAIPYTYEEVPLPVTDNHMISAVKIDGAWIFLDATDPNCAFGMPTSHIQGKEALISINPEKYELVKVPVVPPSQSVITDSTFLVIQNKNLDGRSSVIYSGYFGSEIFTSLLYNKGEDERVYARSRMARGSNKFIMKDYKVMLLDTMNKLAGISCDFEIPDYVKSTGDEIFINLNLGKLFNKAVLDSNKRKVAVEQDFLYTVKQIHALQVPEGYQTEFIPKSISISNELVDLSIEYKLVGSNIYATQQLTNKKLYVTPADFKIWNNTIATASPAYKEQVVLRKK